MGWIVGMRGEKPPFSPNGNIQHIGVCETFVDNRHTVIHKTRIKLSLQVQNVCNI